MKVFQITCILFSSIFAFHSNQTLKAQENDSVKIQLDSIKRELKYRTQKEDSLLNRIEADQKALKEYRRELEEKDKKKSRRERRRERIENLTPYNDDITKGIPDSLKKDQTVAFYRTGRNRVFEGFAIGITGFNYNSLMNFRAGSDLEGFELNHITSVSWSINPIEMDVRIIKEYLKFSTGLGYNVRNFTFANNYEMYKDEDNIVQSRQLDTPDYIRNRFRAGYLTIPALFHINTDQNPAKSFRVAFGGVAGVRIFDTYRRKFRDDEQKVKINRNRGWNVNQFTFDARASVGYGTVQLFATQSLVPLFRKDRGPELYPFTIGISFTSSFE